MTEKQGSIFVACVLLFGAVILWGGLLVVVLEPSVPPSDVPVRIWNGRKGCAIDARLLVGMTLFAVAQVAALVLFVRALPDHTDPTTEEVLNMVDDSEKIR